MLTPHRSQGVRAKNYLRTQTLTIGTPASGSRLTSVPVTSFGVEHTVTLAITLPRAVAKIIIVVKCAPVPYARARRRAFRGAVVGGLRVFAVVAGDAAHVTVASEAIRVVSAREKTPVRGRGIIFPASASTAVACGKTSP